MRSLFRLFIDSAFVFHVNIFSSFCFHIQIFHQDLLQAADVTAQKIKCLDKELDNKVNRKKEKRHWYV